ncbi:MULTISPECIES: hypothetical protein [Gracilibacillus]|uniref:hypothetical protein n=1 Tax=Gracilibacillus TaxID=74385 RepID=UPI0008242014|nr:MULTISPECIES: hypothetical protein [Gracilibacillus]
MKKWIQIVVSLIMLLLAIIPFLVIYDGLSQALPILPIYKVPGWMIPGGFLCIAVIIVFSFFIKGREK